MRFLRPLLSAFAAAPLVLAGCGVHFVGDAADGKTEAIPIITNPPSYPADAVVFIVDVTTQFAGESVDLRFDGVRYYRKSVSTAPGSALTTRVRIPIAPGLHNFYVRVGNETFNVNTETPVNVSAQPCAAVRFAINNDIPQLSTLSIELPPPATCPR